MNISRYMPKAVKTLIAVVGTAFVLSSCGGGGGGAIPQSPTETVVETVTYTPAQRQDLHKAKMRGMSEFYVLTNGTSQSTTEGLLELADISYNGQTFAEAYCDIAAPNSYSWSITNDQGETFTGNPRTECIDGVNKKLSGTLYDDDIETRGAPFHNGETSKIAFIGWEFTKGNDTRDYSVKENLVSSSGQELSLPLMYDAGADATTGLPTWVEFDATQYYKLIDMLATFRTSTENNATEYSKKSDGTWASPADLTYRGDLYRSSTELASLPNPSASLGEDPTSLSRMISKMTSTGMSSISSQSDSSQPNIYEKLFDPKLEKTVADQYRFR